MIFPHSRERASPSLPPSHSFPFWRGEERTLLATFGPLSSSRWASPRPRSLASPSLSSSSSRGGNPGFNPFPYNFLPMHREKLARNTHAHARMAARAPSPLSSSSPPPPLAPAWPLARSLARSLVGGHRLLDFIEFSSSARRHPVRRHESVN
jgi:hypothetical protein